MNWRPIETAPKVWASLLLAKSTYDGHFIEPVIGGWDDGAWRNRNGDHLEGQVVNITHWMPLPPPPSTEPAPQDTGEKWKTSGTGHLCCNGIPVAQFIEPVCQDGRYIPQALNLLAGHDLSQVVVVKKEAVEEIECFMSDISLTFVGSILANRAAKLQASLNV